MLSLLKGLSRAKLLRTIWFQCLFGIVVFFALFQVGAGYEQFYAYKSSVERCVTRMLEADSQLVAKTVKQQDWPNVSNRLNGIEYSCAFPNDFSQNLVLKTEHFEQADFFWVVEKDQIDVLRIGRDLLPGPQTSLVVPLSVWDQGDSGDYWVGSISLDVFYGEHMDMLVAQGWRQFGLDTFKLTIASLVIYLLTFLKVVRPSQRFVHALDSTKMSSSSIRNLIAGRQDELVAAWRVVLKFKEESEVERFEFEAQVRELETHISKVERGQAGQSLSTEHASLDIKNALARTLVLQGRHAREGDQQAQFLSNYLFAVMSVSANLHQRAQMESGELMLADIAFNLRVMALEVFYEYQQRFIRRGIDMRISFEGEVQWQVRGDPEKIKRIVRNAFKRLLLQPNIEKAEYTVSRVDSHSTGPRYLMELVATPRANQQQSMTGNTSNVMDSERGPTSGLEMLCYILGARWVFSLGLDGELKQNLSLALPAATTVDVDKLCLSDTATIDPLRVFIYDLPTQSQSVIYQTVSPIVAHVEYTNNAEYLKAHVNKKSFGRQSVDLLIVNDLVESMSAHEFVSELRRKVGRETSIFVVSDNPQIGDGQDYSDIGIQGYLARKTFAQLGIKAINYLFQFSQLTGAAPELVTRYSLLDWVGPVDTNQLPSDLVSEKLGTVLLLAEELVCIEFTRQHCENFGTRFVHYSSAFEAFDAYRQEIFDLVLVDDRFEDIDPITVIEMLRKIERKRENRNQAPIIALGNVDEMNKEIYLKAGATDVTNKYTIDGTLSAAFEEYLGKQSDYE